MIEQEVTVAPEGTPIRDHIEAAVAQHTPSPDVSNAVAGAVEEHQRDTRQRNDARTPEGKPGRLWEAEARDKRRADIRGAVNDARIKAAQGSSTPQPIAGAEVPAGPPPTWDTKAKQVWDTLPQEARLAALRDHANIKPHLEKYAELDKVLSPVREVYQSQGVKSDAEAVRGLLQWEGAIRNPSTRLQALGDLMRQYGVSPDMLGGSPQQYQQPQYSPEVATTAERQVSQFSQGRPHFAAVRETMGLLMERHGSRYLQADGSVNLDKAYRDACKAEGLAAAQPPANRPRAVLPSRPPAGGFPGATTRTPARQHILEAIRGAR